MSSVVFTSEIDHDWKGTSIMAKRTMTRSLFCIGLGGMLGLAAALAGASSPVRATTPVACCSEANSRSRLLAAAPARALGAEAVGQAATKTPAAGPSQKKAADSGKKPNILIIWGDDIGWFNPSCYHGGVMGYQTPNIDRIAREGARFTDWYGQQSCTAGRAAFIMGQSPIRTGMTKVGLPGAT